MIKNQNDEPIAKAQRESTQETPNSEGKITNVEPSAQEQGASLSVEIEFVNSKSNEQEKDSSNLAPEFTNNSPELQSVGGAMNKAETIDTPFDDVFEGTTDEAMQIWGDVLLSIKANNEPLLYAMCDGVSHTAIKNNEFVLYARSLQDYEGLIASEIKEKLQKYLTSYSNKTLVVVFEQDEENTSLDIEFLKSKFGDKLKIV